MFFSKVLIKELDKFHNPILLLKKYISHCKTKLFAKKRTIYWRFYYLFRSVAIHSPAQTSSTSTNQTTSTSGVQFQQMFYCQTSSVVLKTSMIIKKKFCLSQRWMLLFEQFLINYFYSTNIKYVCTYIFND